LTLMRRALGRRIGASRRNVRHDHPPRRHALQPMTSEEIADSSSMVAR
jgi:hypothetical protein